MFYERGLKRTGGEGVVVVVFFMANGYRPTQDSQTQNIYGEGNDLSDRLISRREKKVWGLQNWERKMRELLAF